MFGIGGKIVKWHYEIIDGRKIRVIDRFKLTEVSIIPERRPTLLAPDRCPRCGAYGGHYLGCITYDAMHRKSGQYR